MSDGQGQPVHAASLLPRYICIHMYSAGGALTPRPERSEPTRSRRRTEHVLGSVITMSVSPRTGHLVALLLSARRTRRFPSSPSRSPHRRLSPPEEPAPRVQTGGGQTDRRAPRVSGRRADGQTGRRTDGLRVCRGGGQTDRRAPRVSGRRTAGLYTTQSRIMNRLKNESFFFES